MLIKIATDNDANGNPRRGWLRTTASGQVLGWIEEGYLGRGAIERRRRKPYDLCES